MRFQALRYARDLSLILSVVLAGAAGTVAVSEQLDLQKARDLAFQEILLLQNEIGKATDKAKAAAAGASLQAALDAWNEGSADYSSVAANVQKGLSGLGKPPLVPDPETLVPHSLIPALLSKPIGLVVAAIVAAVLGAGFDAFVSVHARENGRLWHPHRRGALPAKVPKVLAPKASAPLAGFGVLAIVALVVAAALR